MPLGASGSGCGVDVMGGVVTSGAAVAGGAVNSGVVVSADSFNELSPFA